MYITAEDTTDMKIVSNMKTDFEQVLANKLLLCGHLEPEVINYS